MRHPYGFDLSNAATISGRALHTGVVSTVRATLRPDDGQGIRFLFPGFPAPLNARDLASMVRTAKRSTVLTHTESGNKIRTPEHLLAAALFFADTPINVTCDSEELPGLDGSARPWYELLESLGPHGGGKLRPREYDTGLTWNYTGREGRLRAEPDLHFSVTFTLERDAFRESFHLGSAEQAPDTILPARTFIFWNDWKSVTDPKGAADLLRGAGSESGLLFASSPEEFAEARATVPELAGNPAGNFPLLHPDGPRLEAEAARHKVLDLLGDLALNGLALPRLRLTIVNGGHALNHLLLDALQPRVDGREITTNEGTAS
jgi:UDP-3-O-acyl-N-acetylglucosamine deacetylase